MLRSDMLMRSPTERTPEEPPDGGRHAHLYVLALSIGAFVVAVLIIAYALSIG